jgi:hypothetical protein
MRIRELLEGKQFNDLDFVQHNEDGSRELAFDVAEDLRFFMANNDSVYRKHVYPSIANCVDRLESSRATSPTLFKLAVEESYKEYIREFPLRDLPDDIDEAVCNETCNQMHEEICKEYQEGKYKD